MILLFRVEIRRALSRRLVRVLIALAVVASFVAGGLVFANTRKFDAPAREHARTQVAADIQQCVAGPNPGDCAVRQFEDYDKSIHVTDLWPVGGQDAILGIAIVLLVFGALLAAASFVGADWKTGMFGTLLTWEPRRMRVAGARLGTAALAAAAIALALECVFIAALLPAMLAHGGADGVDHAWAVGLITAMGKGAVLAALAAITGASVALIGRNTAVALGAAFCYLNVVEPAVRAWKPGVGRWLIAENATVFLAGSDHDVTASPFPIVTLALYAAVLSAAAVSVLRRRDIAG